MKQGWDLRGRLSSAPVVPETSFRRENTAHQVPRRGDGHDDTRGIAGCSGQRRQSTAERCYTDRAFLTAAHPASRTRSEFPRLSCASSPSSPLGPAIRDSASPDAGVVPSMSTKLYVGNLPYQTTESD